MPAKSLYRLAVGVGIANIRSTLLASVTTRTRLMRKTDIEDIGDYPYELVRPVLLKVENAKQLKLLEDNCPQIIGADEEIWRTLIKRDIPKLVPQRDTTEPKDPKNWYKVYQKLQKQGDAAQREQDAALVAVLNQKREEKANNKMTFLEKVVDPSKKRPAARPTIFSRAPDSSVMSFGSGSRTRTTTGKGLLLKAKREARENSLFSARRNVLSTPTHLLGDNRGRPRPSTAPRPTTTYSNGSQANDGSSAHRPTSVATSSATPVTQPPKRPANSVFISNKRPKYGKS